MRATHKRQNNKQRKQTHFERSLIGRESDEMRSVRTELAQEARRLLDIDHGAIGEDSLIELPSDLPMGPGPPGAPRLARDEPRHHGLRPQPPLGHALVAHR